MLITLCTSLKECEPKWTFLVSYLTKNRLYTGGKIRIDYGIARLDSRGRVAKKSMNELFLQFPQLWEIFCGE